MCFSAIEFLGKNGNLHGYMHESDVPKQNCNCIIMFLVTECNWE